MEFASLPPLANALSDSSKQHAKPGVVYISRIPPRMTPARLRQLLEVHGELGRLFLSPRHIKNHKALRGTRKAKQEHGEQGFSEGWVEFMDRRIAKSTCEMLNCTNIGHRKGHAFYDDLWNLKYLPKFKWSHLTEQLAYEKAIREQRLRAEISQARKTTEFYMQQVDRAKKINAIETRKQAKAAKAESAETNTEPEKSRSKRLFKQRKPINKDVSVS